MSLLNSSFYSFLSLPCLLIGWPPSCYSSLAHCADRQDIACGTCGRHLYSRNHGDQAWDKHGVCFLLFFFYLKKIYSVPDAFLHDLPPVLQSAPRRKCILWQPFHSNLWSVSLLCSFDVFGILVSLYCTEMVAGNSSLLENLECWLRTGNYFLLLYCIVGPKRIQQCKTLPKVMWHKNVRVFIGLRNSSWTRNY